MKDASSLPTSLHVREVERPGEDDLAIRERLALVRAFSEEVEWLHARAGSVALRAQLVEELARLGCRILETAATISRTTAPAGGSREMS